MREEVVAEPPAWTVAGRRSVIGDGQNSERDTMIHGSGLGGRRQYDILESFSIVYKPVFKYMCACIPVLYRCPIGEQIHITWGYLVCPDSHPKF